MDKYCNDSIDALSKIDSILSSLQLPKSSENEEILTHVKIEWWMSLVRNDLNNWEEWKKKQEKAE